MRTIRRLAVSLILLLLVAAPSSALQPYRSAIVVDPVSGEVLYEHNPDIAYPTASMVKMMTLLVVMDRVRSGDASWERAIEVTARASRVGGSSVYLEPGEVFTLGELVAATMIKSANDAAFLLADTLGDREGRRGVEGFVAEMNAKAQELGLRSSRFYTPHGLPPETPEQRNDVMSARDLATVGSRVLAEPRLAELAAAEQMPFRRGQFLLRSSNHLLRRWDEAIGIKTGWTSTADFCLTAAARRNHRELVAVVMGAERKWDSFEAAQRLLEEAFASYRPVALVGGGQALPAMAPVAGGARRAVQVAAAEPLEYLVRDGRRPRVQAVYLGSGLTAPVRAGQPVGQVAVLADGRVVGAVPAVAVEGAERATWWQRIWGWLTAAALLTAGTAARITLGR